MFRNQRGMTSMEGLIAGALVAALGVGVMKMSENQKNAQRGMMGMTEFTRDLEVMRAYMEEPQACVRNFQDKMTNSNITLDTIWSAKGDAMMTTNSLMANDQYKLKKVTIGAHNPNTLRTAIHMDFEKMEKQGRSQSLRRTFYAMTRVDGAGKIIECIDPLKNVADGTLKQMCLDADPLKVGVCQQNIINLAEEVKQYYCSSHPYLRYDPATKKCFPLDAGKKCPVGQYIHGWKANGDLDCYTPPTPPSVPTTCSSWSAWTPTPSTQCPGTNVVQTRTCTTPGVTDSETRNTDGTKTTGCSSLSCHIYYQGRINGATGSVRSDGTWARWSEDQDHDCDSSPGCGINMGIACTGDTTVTLYYAYRYAGVETGERSVTSDKVGTLLYGGWHSIISGAKGECDSPRTCGLKVRAVPADSDYTCNVYYQYRNEDYVSAQNSNGNWSVMSDPDAGDDNCENNGGCGMVATINCTAP